MPLPDASETGDARERRVAAWARPPLPLGEALGLVASVALCAALLAGAF